MFSGMALIKRKTLFFLLFSFIVFSSGCDQLPAGGNAARKTFEPLITKSYAGSNLQSPAAEPSHLADPSESGTPSQTATENSIVLSATIAPIPSSSADSDPASSIRPATKTSDLLYLEADRLMRWDPRTNYAVQLAGNVREYSVDGSGNHIALLRPKQISANGSELFDLDVLYLESKRIENLLTDIPSITKMSISPDGSRIAYHSLEQSGIIRMQPLSENEAGTTLGSCTAIAAEDCNELAWSPDSRQLLWIDSRGLWISTGGEKAEIVNRGVVEMSDPAGESIQVPVKFRHPQWSPAGRFIILEIHPNDTQVYWVAILDTPTARTSEVIDSYQNGSSNASIVWLPDGTIITTRSSELDPEKPSEVKHWRVVPTNKDILIQLLSVTLDPPELFKQIRLENLIVEKADRLYLKYLYGYSNDHIFWGARLLEKSDETYFFDLNLTTKHINPIFEVSEDLEEIFYAPDGSGFIFVTKKSGVFYADLLSNKTVQIGPQSNENVHSFYWMPPEWRP